MATALPLPGLGIQGLDKIVDRIALGVQNAHTLRNVRPWRGKFETSPGTTPFIPGTVSGTPMAILGWRADDGSKLANIATTTKLYSLNQSTGALTDITNLGGAYTGSVDELWEMISAEDHLIATNGKDNVQKWDGIAANAADLGGIPPKGATLASAQTYVLMANIDPLGGSPAPRKVQWSDAGAFEVWGSGDAGNLTLYQGADEVSHILTLGDNIIAYRPRSVHLLFFVGSPFIWAQRQVFNGHGLFARLAVCDIGGTHIYWGTDNIYAFNGVNRKAVGDKIIDELLDDVDYGNLNRVRVWCDTAERSVYFGYPPKGGSGEVEKAYVFNYRDNTWHVTDIFMAASGELLQLSGTTWDSGVGTWDAQTETYAQQAGLAVPEIVLATNAGKILSLDSNTVDLDGVTRTRTLESGLYDPGRILFNLSGNRVTLDRIEIEVEKAVATTLMVAVGTQDQLGGDNEITWTNYSITLDGTKKVIPTRITSVYFTFRLRTTASEARFRGTGLTAYFNPRGDR